jgi:hypothetical protein
MARLGFFFFIAILASACGCGGPTVRMVLLHEQPEIRFSDIRDGGIAILGVIDQHDNAAQAQIEAVQKIILPRNLPKNVIRPIASPLSGNLSQEWFNLISGANRTLPVDPGILGEETLTSARFLFLSLVVFHSANIETERYGEDSDSSSNRGEKTIASRELAMFHYLIDRKSNMVVWIANSSSGQADESEEKDIVYDQVQLFVMIYYMLTKAKVPSFDRTVVSHFEAVAESLVSRK